MRKAIGELGMAQAFLQGTTAIWRVDGWAWKLRRSMESQSSGVRTTIVKLTHESLFGPTTTGTCIRMIAVGEMAREVIAIAAVGTTDVTRNDYVHIYLAAGSADGACDNLIATSE